MEITFPLIRGVLRSSNHTKTGPSEEGNSRVHRYELQRWTTGVRRAANTLSPAGRWELQRGWGSCGVTKGLAESRILPGDAERGGRKVLPALLLLPGRARGSPRTGRRWGQRWAGRGVMQLSPSGATGPTSPGSARETPRGTRRFSSAPGQAPQPAARGLLPAYPPAPPRKPPHPKTEGGGTTGRAAYPEAGPAKRLHSLVSGAEPLPGPRRPPAG